ncbi:hypothetical protein B296_00024725 [Ensete ventricosum]|uniref:Retrotransposon gag domain-containing protein n=1 Tax=Ensete ventricosum TaxID=4639 RepID=A0A427AS03_ENSVE|nr:hypothetical protein B296_00024725 [Ensete ventricosum]
MLLTHQQKKNLNITDLQSYAMASDNAIDVKLEAFEARMEDRLRTLFKELRLGRSESPKRSQCEESSDHKENQLEKGVQAQDSMFPRIRVDFLRWEDGDPTGWISHVERYFRFYKTQDASMVDIVAIHLEGDAIQWYDWFERTHELEEVDLESEEEDADEEPHPVVSTVHALAGYANSQTMKIDIFLKHQLITVLIDIRSTNNFMDSKVATRLTLQIEYCSKLDVKVVDG